MILALLMYLHSLLRQKYYKLYKLQRSLTSGLQDMCNFLSIILSTHVIFPHEVTKCSQLGLVLLCYKEDDAPHFHQNLQVSPHMFDILVSLIQDSPCFQNNSEN